MEKRSRTFGIKLQNRPTFGLRREFNAYHWLIAKPEFRNRLRRGSRNEPIDTPLFTWTGSREALLTLLLQQAFSGVEAYVVGAAYWEVGKQSISNLKEVLDDLLNPFSLGGRGVPENYYNRVPALVSEHCTLNHSRPQLWDSTRMVYTEVRNPVFHGYEVDRDYASGVLAVFDHIADLYRWIDSWCDPDGILLGASTMLKPKPRGAA